MPSSMSLNTFNARACFRSFVALSYDADLQGTPMQWSKKSLT